MRRYRTFVFDSARWASYEHRAGDIVISTPPKCGTTWTQNIVAMLVLGRTTFDAPMAKLSPWLDQNTHHLEATVADLETQTHRRFIKSHTPADGLPWHEDVTYICVGRDPRDAAVSWDDHLANTDRDRFVRVRAEAVGLDDLDELGPMLDELEDPVARYWQWMSERRDLGDSLGLQFLVHHLHSFWLRRAEPNVVLLHYADLEADLAGEMRRLAGELGFEVDDEALADFAAAARFDAMKDRASELAPNAGEFWKQDGAFFSHGRSGRWRELITEDDGGRYERLVDDLVDDAEFVAWLHRP